MGNSVYPAELSLYKTSSYETVHMGLPVYNAFDSTGDVTRVNAEVRLLNGTQTENIAIQLNNCWATPTPGSFLKAFLNPNFINVTLCISACDV